MASRPSGIDFSCGLKSVVGNSFESAARVRHFGVEILKQQFGGFHLGSFSKNFSVSASLTRAAYIE
jgi:hypothetical protein